MGSKASRPSFRRLRSYQAVIQALEAAPERFATGTYAVWYPLRPSYAALGLPQRLKRLPGVRWLDVALSVRSTTGVGMHGSGGVHGQPPCTLAATLAATLPWLTRQLAQDATADDRLNAQV